MVVFTPSFTLPSGVLSETFSEKPPSLPSVLSIDPSLPDTDERPIFVTVPFAIISYPHDFDEKHFPVIGNIPNVVKFPIKRNGDPAGLPCIRHMMQAKFPHAVRQK
jgi:hypothetical protein